MKILSRILIAAFVFAALFTPTRVSVQTQSQTGTTVDPKTPETTAPDKSGGDYFSMQYLSSDLNTADVAAHVDVKKVKYLDRSDTDTDCEKNTRGGYCAYELTAEVREMFKGDKTAKTIAFTETPDATYPWKHLLGESVVFLVKSQGAKKPYLQSIENSSRPIEHDVLGKMRRIIDPLSAVNEDDEDDPYSMVAIRDDFERAEAVVYADIRGFRHLKADVMHDLFTVQAIVKQGFKGNFKSGQVIEFKEWFSYRPPRRDDMGPRVIYLEKAAWAGEGVYSRIPHDGGKIRHGILEKLSKISRNHENRGPVAAYREKTALLSVGALSPLYKTFSR